MNENQFWQIVQTAKQTTMQADSDDQQLELIETALQTLTLEDILDFQRIFDRLHTRSYRADLWGAAHIINGGATTDGFDYFRGWLIAQGREVFTAALEQPDSLSALFTHESESDYLCELEGLLTVAEQLWMEKTGSNWAEMDNAVGKPVFKLLELSDFDAWAAKNGDADEIKCKLVYPRLWARFGE